MKKFLLLSVFMVISTILFSQSENIPQQRDTTKYIYCQIVGTGRLLSNKVTIEIDFGQFRSIWTDNRLKDPTTGDRIIFNGMIDALNYMANMGWIFVQAYAFSQGNNPPVYHYLMKKSMLLIKKEDSGK
jgi:hypothetical protein